jgi:N-acetylmuramoyl-L-alanine amidase
MDEYTRLPMTTSLGRCARNALLGGLCAFCVHLGPSAAAATPPVRTMYADALAREQAIRVALADPDAALKLEEVRAVVAAYEAVVRQYPASAYSDNAFWQAGHLALDAFWRFGQPQDKETCVRLLQKLAASYPTSKLARQVPEELRRSIDSLPRTATPAVEPAPPRAAEAASAKIATIREIRRAVLADTVRVTIELDGEVPFHDERLADPARVFLDLPGTRAAPALVDQTIRFQSDDDVVRQVRIGRHPNHTTRVVLDAAGVSSYSVYPLYGPYRLVIDCVRASPVRAAATAPALLDARRFAIWQRSSPSVGPQHRLLIALARVALAAPAEPTSALTPDTTSVATTRMATEAPAEPPARNLAGGLSIARQLGLGVSRIVIDAGHGGHDPGAQGKGVTEAELVLDVALRLEKLLQKVPGVEVILTRRTDDFIPLPERTAIANREGADLFLSIHANASTAAQAHGIETYFLNFANNQSAAAVAARENATSVQAMGALPDLIKTIALNNKVDESRDFATHVQRAMVERLKAANKTLRDLGVKQAPFVVLIGAVMPSVLAEISFVTNPQEARLLKGNVYRQRIADALFSAIRKYQTSLKNTATVALQ